MQTDANDSFETALAPQPAKRKRSSILKPFDKRVSRDSRTVSFSDRFCYKELYKDGTCDITNFFLSEDMDISVMDIVDPNINQTIDNSADMSLDQTNFTKYTDLTMAMTHEPTLNESDMIDDTTLKPEPEPESEPVPVPVPVSEPVPEPEPGTRPEQSRVPLPVPELEPEPELDIETELQTEIEIKDDSEEDEKQDEKADIYEVEVEQVEDITGKIVDDRSPIEQKSCMTRISDISSLNTSSLTDHFANDTLYGAFHESNNLSILSNRTSGVDTLMHNVEILNECMQKTDECRRRLDAEIDELFKFYRHIVNKQDRYEFAVAIFGLRHTLWLIIKLNPDTYPNEKLHLRFAFNKKDRHLYPFKEYAQAVENCTKEGNFGYLTRFVINAQRFRRFLRKVGYRKITN